MLGKFCTPKPLHSLARLTAIIAVALIPFSNPIAAQSLIRDAEIEHSLDMIARPILKSAGVSKSSIDILVVNDSSMNAFVINGRAIFLNSGLITRMKSVEMLQAVIGHELAHITNGHLVRRSLNYQSAQTAIGIGVLLAIALAGAGNGDAASGIAVGAASAATNNFLAHTRSEETSADQTAVRYLVRAGIDPMAAVDVMDLFRGQEALQASRQDPYARSHPLSQDRIRALKGQIAAYAGQTTSTSANLKYWHRRMQAKFTGFLGNPAYVMRKLKKSDHSEYAVMVRAIALHRQGKVSAAIKQMNILLSKRPNDAYFHELKGQILLEGRQVSSAVSSYKRAVGLAPKEPLILAGYGRALLSLKSKSGNRKALEVLRKARGMDPRDARMLRDLAVAYAKAGNNGMASLVTAERYALLGRFKDAGTNAQRAEGLLPRGSTGWLRSQDILAAAKIVMKKK